MQNYLIWRLVLDRISSLSQRFKEARVSYRKVSVFFAHLVMLSLSCELCVHCRHWGLRKRLLPSWDRQQ